MATQQQPPQQERNVIARAENFYLAFVAPGASQEPTAAECTLLCKATVEHWEAFFRRSKSIDHSFVRIDPPGVESVWFECGIPEDKYNICIKFSHVDVVFNVNGTAVEDDELSNITEDLVMKSFRVMQKSITPSYILNCVRSLKGTPFASTEQAYFETLESFRESDYEKWKVFGMD